MDHVTARVGCETGQLRCGQRLGSSKRVPCDSDRPSSPAILAPFENHWHFGLKIPWTNLGSAIHEPLGLEHIILSSCISYLGNKSIIHYSGCQSSLCVTIPCVVFLTYQCLDFSHPPWPNPAGILTRHRYSALAWGIASTPGDAAM